jgi:hypothetical protein
MGKQYLGPMSKASDWLLITIVLLQALDQLSAFTSTGPGATDDPYRGGKPCYNVRLWILRDNLWQRAVNQQTTIASAAPVPAVH